MNPRVVMWGPDTVPLGRVVVAIGVFDGVHVGHKELLGDTVAHARRLHAMAVALTFDRDPDQVVTPEAAAAQLLTLAEKADEIARTGIDRVVVVPFTPEIAATEPEAFLDEVVAACGELLAVHVGEDFRFGAGAAGDLDTLYVWGVEHSVDIVAHTLVEVHRTPVTSTRIRGLVRVGDVVEAANLLGQAPRVVGTVGRGRGEGAELGFRTANVRPEPFSAIPADGVYAGIAELSDGSRWPAAISVGFPPTFPTARDFLEAHLIGFEGDLYGQTLHLEFYERLREQERFGSPRMLSEAIGADVAATLQAVADHVDMVSQPILGDEGLDYYDDETPLIEDPAALAAAERAVAALDPKDSYEEFDESWVEVMGPKVLGGLMMAGGVSAFMLTSPLSAAGIPFAWQPFPPEDQSNVRPDLNFWQRFSLFVPPERADEARELLGPMAGAE